jgi:hypothetical protein
LQIKNLKQLAKLVAANKQPYLRFDFDEHVYAPAHLLRTTTAGVQLVTLQPWSLAG